MQKFNADVPPGYFELLTDLTFKVLKDQPSDFTEYAAKFFQSVFEEQGTNKIYESPNREESNSRMSSLMDSLIEEVEEEIQLKPKANFRRKSVAAERINIDDLDDDEDMYKVIPKTDEQRLKLKTVCEQILLFKNLDEDQMGHVINAMFEIKPNQGDKVISQGDEGDNFYIIEKGVFRCFIKDSDGNDKLIHTYQNEGYFGELALMYNAQRSATVIAETECSLWAMDRQTFRVLVVAQTHNKKQTYDAFLKQFPIFQEITPSERMNVADALVSKSYDDKELIIKQGKPGQEMFFIENGEVLITRLHQGKEKELVRLTTGQYFGELALLSNQARQASAMAVGHVRCAMLDVKTFERIMGPCLEVMKRNAAEYKKQLADVFGTEVG